ncbi:MAG: RHS repeat-associated core domain-containing protein, partial [Lysobacterales bacterium]
NGENILYGYDGLNRPVTKQLPDGTLIQISYSLTNKIETISDARGITQYVYNAQDRLQRRIDPNGLEIAYEYDEAGNITAITTPSGTSTYVLDTNGRLASVTDAQGKITSYSYDVLGNLLAKQLPNGTVEQRSYDSFDRLSGVSFIASSGAVLQQFSYEYDSAGFFSTVTDLDGQVMNFGYDQFGRLEIQRIALTGEPERVIQYEYDLVGNRVRSLDSENGTTLFVYDANDRLLSREELQTGVITDYSYDANGSLVFETSPVRSVRYYRDANRRISRTEITENDVTTGISYEYDFVGNRVAEIRNGMRTDFVIDTSGKYSRILDEINASGDVLASYTYGDKLISQSRDGVAYYYLSDLHSGIRALQLDSEQLVNEYMYDAFGNTLQSSGTAMNTYKYRSERLDTDTENYYLRARVYDAKSGRFLSTDVDPGSAYLPVSQHPYLYANANPVVFSDPGGESTIAEFAIAGLIATTIAAISIQVYARVKSGLSDVQWSGPNYVVSGGITKPDFLGFGLGITNQTAVFDERKTQAYHLLLLFTATAESPPIVGGDKGFLNKKLLTKSSSRGGEAGRLLALVGVGLPAVIADTINLEIGDAVLNSGSDLGGRYGVHPRALSPVYLQLAAGITLPPVIAPLAAIIGKKGNTFGVSLSFQGFASGCSIPDSGFSLGGGAASAGIKSGFSLDVTPRDQIAMVTSEKPGNENNPCK